MSFRLVSILLSFASLAFLFGCGHEVHSAASDEPQQRASIPRRIARNDTESSRPGSPSNGRLRALLIGCSDYDHGGIRDLHGPPNDIRFLREVLVNKFHFPDNDHDIVVLSDAAKHRATAANIRAEFQALAKTAVPGGQVVILLSGHGGRQLDDDGDEADGYDEVFCPVDIELLKLTGGVGKGGITDDEIGRWLTEISDRGANVWLIADSCHNGTLTRGADDAPRGIGPLLLTRGSTDAGESHETPKGKIVAFYAAPPTRKTYDTLFDGVPHGLFTHTICNVLKQSSQRLTYRQLIRRVHDEYQNMRRLSPTPQLEAEAKDTLVLGDIEMRGSDLRITKDNGDLWLNAGRLHSVSDGTIFAVHDYSKETTGLVGYVRVREAKTLRSAVDWCDFAGVEQPLPTDFPADNFCELAHANLNGQPRLKVAIDDRTASGRPLSLALRQSWQTRLSALERRTNSQIEAVGTPGQADWLVRVANEDNDTVYLAPADRFEQHGGDRSLFMSPADKDPTQWLAVKLGDIAKSCRLLEIAYQNMRQAQSGIKLDVELRPLADEDDFQGDNFTSDDDPNTTPGTVLHSGQLVGVHVKNPNRFPVYVTILFVNGQFETHSYFPDRPDDTAHRLEACGRSGDSFMPVRFKINSETLGLERLLVIAVKDVPNREPPDLTFLGSRTKVASKNLASPLEGLLAARVSGSTTRDVTLLSNQRQSIEPHAFRVVTWRTELPSDEERGILGRERGPAEDIGAQIVIEADSKYHTADRTKAVLGTYGRFIKGKKLLRRPHRYEPHTLIQNIERARRFSTVRKVGRTGRKCLGFLHGAAIMRGRL